MNADKMARRLMVQYLTSFAPMGGSSWQLVEIWETSYETNVRFASEYGFVDENKNRVNSISLTIKSEEV